MVALRERRAGCVACSDNRAVHEDVYDATRAIILDRDIVPVRIIQNVRGRVNFMRTIVRWQVQQQPAIRQNLNVPTRMDAHQTPCASNRVQFEVQIDLECIEVKDLLIGFVDCDRIGAVQAETGPIKAADKCTAGWILDADAGAGTGCVGRAIVKIDREVGLVQYVNRAGDEVNVARAVSHFQCNLVRAGCLKHMIPAGAIDIGSVIHQPLVRRV